VSGGPDRRRWFERQFAPGLPTDAFPDILERLRGTPARVEERVRGVPAALLTRRTGDAWSLQENAGHLLDLEPLWAGRLDDLRNGAPTLRAADLTNRATEDARHNAGSLAGIVAAFRAARAGLVQRLEDLGPDALRRTARHPRLAQAMSVVDLMFFVAEHDDHHLARMTELRRAAGVADA
jgi:uncharacterized damage-inducible protein DinB